MLITQTAVGLLVLSMSFSLSSFVKEESIVIGPQDAPTLSHLHQS